MGDNYARMLESMVKIKKKIYENDNYYSDILISFYGSTFKTYTVKKVPQYEVMLQKLKTQVHKQQGPPNFQNVISHLDNFMDRLSSNANIDIIIFSGSKTNHSQLTKL